MVIFITMQNTSFSVNDMKCAPQYSAYLRYYSIFYIRACCLYILITWLIKSFYLQLEFSCRVKLMFSANATKFEQENKTCRTVR